MIGIFDVGFVIGFNWNLYNSIIITLMHNRNNTSVFIGSKHTYESQYVLVNDKIFNYPIILLKDGETVNTYEVI
jgi:hypothetical protein